MGFMNIRLPLIVGFISAIGLHAVAGVSLERIGSYRTGKYLGAAAEIVAHDAKTQRLFIVNGAESRIDIVDISVPTSPRLVGKVDVGSHGSDVQSVAIRGKLLAAAVQGRKKSDPGKAVFFDLDGGLLGVVTVGSLPDMITFSPDGRFALTANEGEPEDDYSIDPLGTVSIIEIPADGRNFRQENVVTLDFKAWDGVQIPGTHPGRPHQANSVNFEPEYIAVSGDSKRAWVALQESNAIAAVDIESKRIVEVKGLGFKDHLLSAMDVSDKDGGVRILPWPVKGMYQPDTMVFREIDGRGYLISANEGDIRDWKAWSEETRVEKLTLDPLAYPSAGDLQRPENLGRLKTSKMAGDANGDGLVEQIYAFGGRSFSIWDADTLALVYDSGSDFEYIGALLDPKHFNADHETNDSVDSRSDDKGVEPEAIAVGEIDGDRYAFIAFERLSGIAVYNISEPARARFVGYTTSRVAEGDPKKDAAGDLGPECVIFIAGEDSPNGEPMLVVANEVSGSTTLYRVLKTR